MLIGVKTPESLGQNMSSRLLIVLQVHENQPE